MFRLSLASVRVGKKMAENKKVGSIANFQMAQGTGKADQIQANRDIGCCGCILMFFSICILVLYFPFSLICSLKIVQEYERAVIFRLGKVTGGAKGPGLFFLFPFVDTFRSVDLRTFSYDIPPQEILTKDSVTVAVDGVLYVRVFDPITSIINVENAPQSTKLLAATTLRNILGTKNLNEILSDRENISHAMQVTLDDATKPWGVKVERIEIKDVRLPVQMQRAMAAEAESEREARAKVIAAEGEMKASQALKEAADIMSEAPAALQLRYLQTLNSIAAEKNSTIIFPIPIDFIGTMSKKKKNVIAADGEKLASKALKEAADIISQSPSALQLRYLQTLNSIAAEKNSTIIFPMPIDFVSCMLKK